MESGEYLLITICQNEINYDSKFNGGRIRILAISEIAEIA